MVSRINGINLSNFNEQQWEKRTIAQFIKISIIFIFLFSLAILLQLFASSKKQNIKQLLEHKNNIELKLSEIEHNIAQLNQQQAIDLSHFFTKNTVLSFNQLMRQIPIKTGGIEVIHFYFDDKEKIKIAGKYEKQTDFELLEKYFKNQGFKITIEYLQSNGKIKADFSLVLEKE